MRRWHRMPFYIRLDDAAKSLHVTADELIAFEKCGWINFTYFPEANITYLKGHQQYRARFILALRDRLKLSPEQISKVLENQKPPYSLADVPEVLKRAGKAG
jgi:hypothetical protein